MHRTRVVGRLKRSNKQHRKGSGGAGSNTLSGRPSRGVLRCSGTLIPSVYLSTKRVLPQGGHQQPVKKIQVNRIGEMYRVLDTLATA